MIIRPTAEILTIGTELLTGSVINSNAQYLGRGLTRLGFLVANQTSCRDDAGSIADALRRAMHRASVIFISGGLGPTPDDITRESIADYFGVPLVFSKTQFRQIQKQYLKRKKPVPSIVKREAYFPGNALPVFNRYGIALGFVIEEMGCVIIVVPGVPGEVKRLFENHLVPMLKKKFRGLRPPIQLVVKTIGLSEPTVMRRLGKKFFTIGPFQFGIYPEVGEVALRIYADSMSLINRLKRYVTRALGSDIYSFDDVAIETVIGRKLVARNQTVSVAESCTGGRVAGLITGISGASRYFLGGIVAYQDDVKSKLLDIRREILLKKGAVSLESARAMASGVRKKLRSTYGISVTGIAGPSGATGKKPVGLVYISIASPFSQKTWELHFTGDRSQVQRRAAKKTLEYLWRWLQNKK